jgi:hypothetical protein
VGPKSHDAARRKKWNMFRKHSILKACGPCRDASRGLDAMTRRVKFLAMRPMGRPEKPDGPNRTPGEPARTVRRDRTRGTVMAQTESIVDQGVDRVQDALKSADKEFQRLQRRVKTQRRTIERRIDKQRKNIEKQAKKQAKTFEKQAQKQIKEFRKNDLVKRAETFGKDVQAQIESGLESVLGVFQVATKSDVQRIDRKLNRISRKLKELESPEESPQQ